MNKLKFSCVLYWLMFSIFINNSFAAHFPMGRTIWETSIDWNNDVERNKLLSDIPIWSTDTIDQMFQVYLDPAKYALKQFNNETKHNVQFINAFWGPLNNPFIKFDRPAKAFVFVDGAYHMAPIIKNSADNNFYVFDTHETRPLLLRDWVIKLSSLSKHQSLKFNICKAYAYLPNTACLTEKFQSEANIYSNANQLKNKAYPSAYRPLQEDWSTRIAKTQLNSAANEGSIYQESVDWKDQTKRDALLSTVATWDNYEIIFNNFKLLRNIRFFAESNFQRRISWLYPDDGCWTRASAVIRDLFGPFNNIANQFSRPAKIFAFGNLCANTKNSTGGYVSWWYHTAPIIRDKSTNQTYVLDPSVNDAKPLPTEEWLNAITSHTGACAHHSKLKSFNICNGYAASPNDKCEISAAADFATETENMLDQKTYLSFEWQRQLELSRNPTEVLGDSPPWGNA